MKSILEKIVALNIELMGEDRITDVVYTANSVAFHAHEMHVFDIEVKIDNLGLTETVDGDGAVFATFEDYELCLREAFK